MTVRRLVVCMLVVVAISIVNIYHHALVVKSGYKLGRIQARNARLRVSIADLEGKVTMLASPLRLRDENVEMQLGLVGPSNWRETPSAVALASLDESERTLLGR